MESLTVADSIELIRLNEAAMVAIFQTWLTITFATIVAVFAGRHLLTKAIRWMVTSLYLLSSISITAASVYLAENSAQLINVLTKQGVSFDSPMFAGVSFFTLFLVGVATTVYFIHLNPDEAST